MKQQKGWMRPHELDRRDGRKPFDPVAEGSRYRLSQELSLAIWERACAEAVDRNGQPDLEQAKRRFHAIAAGIATRGGRWPHSDVGKRTLVETERHGSSARGVSSDELATRVPGRRTLVEAEASRWESTATAAIESVVEGPTEEIREGVETTAPGAPERRDDPAAGERQLPVSTLERMEKAFGRRFDDVEIHVDSAEVPTEVEAFTRGRHIFFGRGVFVPESPHGEHVIAHELAHVAQQSAPTPGGGLPTRAALEADAHQAALSALAGHATTVSVFAPMAAALGFSDGKAPQAPSSGGSGGSSQSTPGAPGRSSGGSARAPASGGGAIPRPKPALSARAPARSAGAAPGAVPASPASRRSATGDGLRIPEAPSALTPAAAGRLGTVQAGNQGNAAATTALPTGQQQTDVGRAAVEEPQSEQDARAKHGVVTGVDDRPPPSPEIEEACARIRQVIRDKRPPDEDKLIEAKPREMAQEAGQQMSAGVEQRAGSVREGYADMQQPPPGSPSSAPVPPTLPPQQAETQPVDAGAAAPDPLHPDDVSLDADVAGQKKQIEDAGMNTEPGKLVEDGPIGDARGGADELSGMAKTDPAKVIADQAAAVAKAKGDMRALQESADKALAAARTGAVDQMGTHTTGVKGSEEQQRAQAGERMNAVFTQVQKTVDGLLQPLSGDASARWDAGVAVLSREFEDSLADVKRRIDERHSGFGGGLVKAWDKMTGLPDWATEGYDRAEAKFGDGATSLIRDISRDVNAVIEKCKQLIQQARKDIDAVVKSLPASLQTWAQGEAAKLGQQLDALDKRVDQTQKGINKDLINRANTAVQEVRQRVHELREAAKGLLNKIAAALAEFAKNPFKAIVNGLLRVLGIPPASFWGLVDRLGDVVGAIAKDPVKFGKTLISGAAQGFKQFFAHFPTHLKEILMSWLFGTMGTAGVPMPTDFSAAGIMPTVLGIVGIDTGMISSMLGADVSDPAEMAEAKAELSGVLSGDPKALVNLFREHFDPASLIPMIREAAMSFLMQALIMAVAPRIAAMLVPGGAILAAVEAIFKVLMWVVSNAARIFTLIESLVATAGQAVAGNVSGVAAGVESGLVQIIVLVIDFLAGYIGLGGIGAKLKGVIMKVSGKLKGILKKALDAIKKRAKAKAKAKRDHKPADKKPDADHAGPTHPKQDDRDPQKAKDDAKDPRNHKPDPDDKDPRNHKPDDDAADPKKHKDGDDDRDPKKHKDGDDDRKKHENDQAEARRAARAAANRGWTAARNASERAVLSKAELKSVLSRAAHSSPKVHISLEIQDKGTSWDVKAEAKVERVHATDTEGNGWIARGDGSQQWYASRDLRAFNRKLIDDGFRQLDDDRGDDSRDEALDGRAQYDHKVRQGKQVVERMQQRIDGEIRGLKVDIEMEPWSGVEDDGLILTRLTVKPNTTEGKRDVEAGIKRLAKLEVDPVVLAEPSQELARVLIASDSGGVIFQKDGDPRKVASQVLKDHQDASFDASSATLTLPAPHAQSFAGAQSVDQIGQLLAQQTGVSKIIIRKKEKTKGLFEIEIIGAIGRPRAVLVHATINIEDWFGFKLNGTSGVRTGDPELEPDPGGSFLPHPFKDEKYGTAYLATIANAPASSEHAEQRLTAPKRIGDVYSEAFKKPGTSESGESEPDDLRTRFALVIGINKLDDLDGDAPAEVERIATAGVGHDYPWATIGFTWQHPWTRTAGGTQAPIRDVRQQLSTLTPELQDRVRRYRDEQKIAVPMGIIRDTIHKSNPTMNFAAELKNRAHRVFIQVGDSDVLSLNPEGADMPYFNRFDRLVKKAAGEIASHGKDTSSSGDHRPIIASGGYQLRMQVNPGDGGAPDIRTKLASELDMKVRAAMAKLDAGLVYFPEPNLIIEITDGTFELTFGNPKMESRGLARAAITALKDKDQMVDLVWDEDVAMVTTPPDRFEIERGATMTREWVTIKDLSAKELRKMFEQSQSHADKRNWALQVLQSVGLPAWQPVEKTDDKESPDAPKKSDEDPKGYDNRTLFHELYDAAFPINWDDEATYLPLKDLRSKLTRWRPDTRAIAQIRETIKTRLELQERSRKGKKRSGPEPTANLEGGHGEVAERVAIAATDAGEVVKYWLLEKLPRK